MGALFGAFVKVKVSFRPARPERVVDVAPGTTVAELMSCLNAPVDGTMCVRRNVPVAENAHLADGDALTFISSFSGG